MQKSINVNEFLRFWQSLETLAQIENANLTKDELIVKINKTYHLANIAFGQGGANLVSTSIIKVSEQSDINDKIYTLVQNNYTITQICEALGLHRTTFYKKNKNNTWNTNDFEAISKLYYDFQLNVEKEKLQKPVKVNVEKEKLQKPVIENTEKNVEKEKLQKPTKVNVEKEKLQNYNELKTIVEKWQNQYKQEKVLRVHKKEIAKVKKMLVWKNLPAKAYGKLNSLKSLRWITTEEDGILEADHVWHLTYIKL